MKPHRPHLRWVVRATLLAVALASAACGGSTTAMKPKVVQPHPSVLQSGQAQTHCAGDVCFTYVE